MAVASPARATGPGDGRCNRHNLFLVADASVPTTEIPSARRRIVS